MLSHHEKDAVLLDFTADMEQKSASSNTSKKSQTVSLDPASNTLTMVLVSKHITEHGNDLQLQFMRACNIAARHANSPELHCFVCHILDNSHYYSKKRTEILMGKHKLCNQCYCSFTHLVNVIKTLVDKTRQWIHVQTGNTNTPFITVGHNGWDSKDSDMLGVCIHFADIENSKMQSIAVGLQQLHSKKSNDIANHVLEILKR